MTERTTVRLPSELLDKARRKAAREHRTLTSLMEEGLRHVVSEKKLAPRKVELPVSSARGGFKDISYADIQEVDDIEYMERLRNGFK